MTKKEYAAYKARVEEFFSHGLTNLSPYPYKCPECNEVFVYGECPECGKDAGEFPVEPFFSWHSCQCCGQRLGGDRYECNGYNEKTGEIEEYDCICQDCVYFDCYDRLDDTTIMEIEADNTPEDEEENK